MPLQMISGDITEFKADAVAVPVGWEYVPWLPAGSSELAEDAAHVQAACVFRTSVPTWRKGRYQEAETLRNCYRSLLALMVEHKCRTISIPVLGLEPGGFDKSTALRIAGEEIYAFLDEKKNALRTVYLFTLSRGNEPRRLKSSAGARRRTEAAIPPRQQDGDVDDFMRRIRTEKENFHDMLFRLIWNGETTAKKRKEQEVAVYRSIFMSRQQFGKLREPGYSPSKETILWLAVALHLSPEETHELLSTAGYTFCRWKDFDLIVLYFISKGVYDIMLINEMLCSYGQKTFLLC